MFTRFVLAVFLGIAWVMLTGRLGVDSFVLGFILSFIVLTLLQGGNWKLAGRALKPGAAITYFADLIRQILTSDFDLMRRILSPGQPEHAGLLEIPVGSKSDVVAALSAHAITSAPGSFVADYADNDTMLIVHSIDRTQRETLEAQQKRRAELAGLMLDETRGQKPRKKEARA